MNTMASLAEEELQKIIKELYLDKVDEEALFKKIMSCDFNTANVIVDILFDIYSRAEKIYDEKKDVLGLETKHSKDFEYKILGKTAFIYVEPYVKTQGLKDFLKILWEMQNLDIISSWSRWREKGKHYDSFPTEDETRALMGPKDNNKEFPYDYYDESSYFKEEQIEIKRYSVPEDFLIPDVGNDGWFVMDNDFKKGITEFDLVKLSLPYSLATKEDMKREAKKIKLVEEKLPQPSFETPDDIKKAFDEVNKFYEAKKLVIKYEGVPESIPKPPNTTWLDFFKNYTYEDFGLAGYGVPKFSYNEDSGTVLYGVKKKRLKDGWQKTLFDLIYYETTRRDKLVRIPFHRFIEEMEERGFEDGYGESEEGDKAILKKYDDNIYQLNKTLNKEFGFKDLKIINLSQHTKVITFEDKALLNDLLS